MNCPKCKYLNSDDAKFCLTCGNPLSITCANCGKILPQKARFCDECGFEVDQETATEKFEPTTNGERKHVTVLFSDLSGYTAMSEKLDPEEVKEITSNLFGDVSKIITSDQYLYFKSLTGLGFCYWGRGEGVKALEAGKAILDYSKQHSNIRSTFAGHWIIGLGYLAKGEFQLAIDSLMTAVQIAKDPFYAITAKHFLGMSYLDLGLLYETSKKADEARESILRSIKVFEECEADGFIRQARVALENLNRA